MFALHETTQRRVCRVSFLLLCVVPTMLTLVGVAYCNRPWRQADWQQTLANRLHVRAEVDDVHRPTPGTMVLTNLHLADLQTDAPLGWTEQLTFRRDDGQLLLEADGIELPIGQLGSLINALKHWSASSDETSLTFKARRFSVTTERWPALVLNDLSIRMESSSDEQRKFRLAAQVGNAEPLRIEMLQSGKNLRCVIDAKQAALPAWVVGQMVPGLRVCGDARFTGAITTEASAAEQRGKLVGTLSEIDARHWTGTASHQIQGIGHVNLEEVLWQNGSLTAARGNLVLQSGAASYSLLLDMREILKCRLASTIESMHLESASEMVPFEELALSFGLSQRGLAFAGDESGQLMVSSAGPLLFIPEPNPPVPQADIVRLFHHPTLQGWLPATRDAHDMAEQLPLPKVQNKEQH